MSILICKTTSEMCVSELDERIVSGTNVREQYCANCGMTPDNLMFNDFHVYVEKVVIERIYDSTAIGAA